MEPIVLHNKAHMAGMEAGYAIRPRAMVVHGEGQDWLVNEGLCGFAWVNFKGNTAFGRALMKRGICRKGYPSGLTLWIYQFNQSWERKKAYAQAYAKVLNENGVEATWGERLD